MEPDLGGQEKCAICGHPIDYTLSQWSLTLEVRKRRMMLSFTSKRDWSQWSLTLEVRKRLGLPDRGRPRRLVAMEPDLGGQEKE